MRKCSRPNQPADPLTVRQDKSSLRLPAVGGSPPARRLRTPTGYFEQPPAFWTKNEGSNRPSNASFWPNRRIGSSGRRFEQAPPQDVARSGEFAARAISLANLDPQLSSIARHSGNSDCADWRWLLLERGDGLDRAGRYCGQFVDPAWRLQARTADQRARAFAPVRRVPSR